jgi:hypothetical protein
VSPKQIPAVNAGVVCLFWRFSFSIAAALRFALPYASAIMKRLGKADASSPFRVCGNRPSTGLADALGKVFGVVAVLFAALVASDLTPVRGNDGGDPNCYLAMPEWDQAVAVEAEVADCVQDESKTALTSRFVSMKQRRDSLFNGTAPECQEIRDLMSQQAALTSQIADHKSEFNAHQLDAEQHQA